MKSLPQQALIPIVFAVGLAIGVGAFWFAVRPTLAPRPATVATPAPEATTTETTTEATTTEPADNTDIFNPGFLSPPSSASGTLDVTWWDEQPQELNEQQAQNVFRSISVEGAYAQNAVIQQLATSTSIWQVGRVTTPGAYQGLIVYLWKHTEPAEIGGDGAIYNYLLEATVHDKTQLLLLPESPSIALYPVEDSIYFVPAPNLKIRMRGSSGLQDTMTLKNGKRLIRGEADSANMNEGGKYAAEFFDTDARLSAKEIGQTVDGFHVYDGGAGCVFIFGKDGLVYSYVSVIADTGGIEWGSGFSTTSTYSPYQSGGCGFHDCADIMSDADVGSALINAGKTADGGSVFVPRNPASNKLFQGAYESAYYPDGQKPTLDAWAKQHPTAIFFWKDAFGRWVKYINTDLQPMAECGKPVIYLYPKQTTSVSVKLPSFINVTVSEPTYPANGWNVTANPDGALLTRDGASYGSLYWEGTGVGYDRPKDGFLVKDGDVDSFLQKTLAAYGLNEKESREFREFWTPKMTGAPYYRVSFLTSAWSNAAPLRVSPRPETVIRIFMDWQKLNAPVSIPEPKIETPVRRGFTLVEWGGLLQK